MRAFFLFLTVGLTLLSAQPAHADLLRALFPSMYRDTYNPYATMKAPFAEKDDQETQEPPQLQTPEDIDKLIPKPSEVIPVHLPHATIKDIKNWITTAASDALTFENSNLKQEQKDALEYFTPAGQKQYLEFLDTNDILAILRQGEYRVSSVVEAPPIFIGEREDQGRYKWLFEAPMLISYINKDAESYDKNTPFNRQAVLKIQVVRVNNTESKTHNILIELWQGSVSKQN